MSITVESRSEKKTSYLFSALLLIVSLIIIGAVNILNAKYSLVIHRVLIFLLIVLTLKCIKKLLIRNIFVVVLLFPVALDVTIQLYAWRNFASSFSYGFALSVLNTTPAEATSMLGLYWRDSLIFFGISALFILAVNTGTCLVSSRWHCWPLLLLCLILIGDFVQAFLHHIRKSNVESLTQRIVQSTPISTAKVFMQAVDDISVVASIGKHIPDYKIAVAETGIDNYVIIIGESERTANMSIYGYNRETTPELEAQRNNLLLFRNAVSPAPVTIMAVPLILTADTVTAHDPRKYSDNIINIANKAGYNTYWYSRQGTSGAYNNVITGIAMNTRHHAWVAHGYDDALLPLLGKALKNPGKKLIVLHLYGSHEPACTRFPVSQSILTGRGEEDDCYDNSVRFTDSFMGKVFQMLGNSRSSVMYFSDHALIRDPQRAVVYSHAGVHPPAEALHVPMFIWYSQYVDYKDKKTGYYTNTWSIDDVNLLAERWLGISRDGRTPQTVGSWLASYNKQISIMDTTGNVYDWQNIH